MILPSQKDLFSLPREICYLNAAYMTPQTKAMQAAGEAGVAARAQPWNISEHDFFTDPEAVRELFAGLISTAADNIAIVPAASYGIAVAAKNIKLKPGQAILLLDAQFPSNVYSWQRMAEEQSLDVIHASTHPDNDWTASVMEVLEREGERIGLVALPHCHWANGAQLDLELISEKVRAIGAKLVLDLTQSLVVSPFDLAKVDPDFMVASGYKWLMCPYTISFFYVAPRHHNCAPLEENWLNRLGSENFAGLVDYEDRYQWGARRFDVGERANFALMPQARAVLEQFHDWGVENMQETIAAYVDRVAHMADGYGFKPLPAKLRAPHLLGVEAPVAPDQAFLQALRAQGVYLSVRGKSLRIAPHVYNDDEDLDRLERAFQSLR